MHWSEVPSRPLATPAFKNPGQGRSRAFSGTAHHAPAGITAGLNRPPHAAGRTVAVFRSRSCGHAAHADINAAVDIHRAGKDPAIPWSVQGRTEPPMDSPRHQVAGCATLRGRLTGVPACPSNQGIPPRTQKFRCQAHRTPTRSAATSLATPSPCGLRRTSCAPGRPIRRA